MTRLLAMLVTAVLALVVSNQPAQAVDAWSNPVAASVAGEDTDYATTLTTADGTGVIAVWRNISGAKYSLKGRSSTDGGVTWSDVYTLTAPVDDVDEYTAVLSPSGDAVVVIWDQNSGADVVRATASRDGGLTWSSPVALNAAGASNGGLAMAISADGSRVTAAWTQDSRSVVNSSADFGATWSAFSTPLSVVGQSTDRTTVAMSDNGNTVYVGWVNYTQNPDSIQIARSGNGGGLWQVPLAGTRISSNAADAFDRLYLATSATGSGVVALWNTSSGSVAANRSEDGADTWLAGPDIGEISATGFPWALSISDDGTRVAAAVQRSDGSNNRPAVRLSSNGGTSWGSTAYVSSPGATVYGQTLTMSPSGGSLVALWRADTSLGVSRSSDGGAAWVTTHSLDATGLSAITGSLSASSDLSWVNVAWIQVSGAISRAWVSRTAPAPTATAVSPSSGPLDGGTTVTITGTGFVPGAKVTIGGTPATDVSVVSATKITATTPAGAAGTANVEVTNVDKQSGSLLDGYTYAKRAQEPVNALKFVKNVKPGKWVKVLATPVQTTAGQKAKVSAIAKSKGKKVAKKYFKTRTKKGHFQVRSSGKKKLAVTIKVKAPETSDYLAMSRSKKYTVKKG